MNIVIACALLVLFAAMAAETLYRIAQVGIHLFAIVFGARYFRPEELPRAPFYIGAGLFAGMVAYLANILFAS